MTRPILAGPATGLKLLAALASLTGVAAVAEPDAAVRAHLAKARVLAGSDLRSTYVHRCITAQAYPQFSNDLQRKGPLPATRVFDQLYFVGENAVSSWALDTSEGIVLFDALNGPEDVTTTIVPAMQKMGLDPARVKYVVLTHGHGDHFGGINAMRALSGARVISTDADWQELDRQRNGPPREGMPAEWSKLAPERDKTVAEGDTLKVGATTLNFYVTPGHTPGTLSTVFDVTDGGKPHRIAFLGGLGLPRSPEALRQYSASLDRFAGVVRATKADTVIANHQTQDETRTKLEELRWRTSGQANPYVLGVDTAARFFQVQAECGRVALARLGFDR